MKQIPANHIRAARALLDWDQGQLSDESGVAVSTLANLEAGRTVKGNPRTYEAISRAFQKHCVIFTDNGPIETEIFIKTLSGENYFIDLLDDIYDTLIDEKKPEVLTIGSDDRENTLEVTQRLRKFANAGFRMRDMIEEGNAHMIGPVTNYRWLPRKVFENNVKIIYQDKVFVDLGDRGLLMHNKKLAELERGVFDYLWDILPELTIKSTANERL